MNHTELRAARESLGFTLTEAAKMLDVSSAKTLNRIESDPRNATHRPAPLRLVRLYRSYLGGYRPSDWPERLIDREKRIAEIDEVRT